MKNILFALTVSMFMVSGVLIGCQSPTEKKEAAEKDLQEAKEDLQEARQEVADSLNRVTPEEYQAYQAEVRAKIQKNEARIAELRVKRSKPGKTLDEYYESRIVALEKRNRELREKVDTYDRTNDDWVVFKRQVDRDMEELAKAIEDLFTDKKD